ncbi:MAG TPA: hypothetical protein VES67_00690 [Vicinamibacterales bacterium]|nr:hypothetical protein [Vicinamibacterales bacterium]
MRILAIVLIVVAVGLTVVTVQSTDQSRTSDSLERVFAPGGRIKMDLSAGGYRIEPSRDNVIRMNWSVRDAWRLSRTDVRADVRGSEASLMTDGSGNGFRVVIEVPRQSNLHVRLTAGELTLRGIEGDKDVELHAGELDLDVGRAEDYGRVDAGIWAGELDASPFRVSKEGLFRSFRWTGQGKYRLHAHLKAGEIRMRASGPAK